MGRSKRPSKEELEEDKFLEWILEVGEYIKSRAQFFIGGAVGVVVILAAISYVQTSRETARIEASALLGKVLIAESNGQLEEGLRLSEQLVDLYSGTPAAAQGLVQLGNRYYSRGRYAEAEERFQSYLDEHGDVDVLVYSAWSGIAACYESLGELERAAAKYTEYADQHEGHMQAALALMNAARCYRLAGDVEMEKRDLERITRDYAKSPVAGRARDQLSML